jgi:hypothetical protein
MFLEDLAEIPKEKLVVGSLYSGVNPRNLES